MTFIKRELKEKTIDEENNDLYLLIKNSSVVVLSEKETKDFFKLWTYHTSWISNWLNITIFDLEKDSILPEVRFLDWFSWWWKIINNGYWFSTIIWFIIIFWLLWFVLYNNFIKKDIPKIEKTNLLEIKKEENLWLSNFLWWNTLKEVNKWTGSIKSNELSPNLTTNIEDLEYNIEIIKKDNEKENLIKQWIILDLENNISFLNWKIKLLNFEKETIKENLKQCLLEKDKINTFIKKELDFKETLLNKNNVLLEEIELKNKTCSNETVNFINIWKDIIKKCKTQKNISNKKTSALCNKYLYNFFTLDN